MSEALPLAFSIGFWVLLAAVWGLLLAAILWPGNAPHDRKGGHGWF